MKTTVELPDALFVAAKKQAAEERRPLRDLIIEGLRTQVKRRRGAKPGGRRIEWVTVKGGLPDGVDLADRAEMHDWLRRARG
jgi:hypothetical protein